jgi:uncharacterized cupredoxin-like copper-binding protein
MKAAAIGTFTAVGAAAALGTSAPALAGGQPAAARAVSRTALVAQVTVAASEFKFVLSKKSAKRGIVIFKVTNVGKLKHDFQIDRRKTRLLAHGQSETLRVVFARAGHYTYTCTVPGHAALGMKGVFTIT